MALLTTVAKAVLQAVEGSLPLELSVKVTVWFSWSMMKSGVQGIRSTAVGSM